VRSQKQTTMNKILQLTFLLIALFTINSIQAQVKKKVMKKTSSTTAKKKTAPKPKPAPAVLLPPPAPGTRIKISTDMGDMVVRLYDKTPNHRDNFIKLVKDHFYDSLLFHRVINGFMIQGGDPGSKTAPAGTMLGGGDIGYTIPAEFDTTLFHKRGALCAARTNNPQKASSGCQFYIVQGRKISDGELDNIQAQSGIRYTPAQRMTYKMNGGTPFLDMGYTVFGEVESGIEVVDKIATAEKAPGDRPIKDIHMKMEIIEETKQPEKQQ
jgi:cyclophilin family peptidyl-prolyl cis-trans isomerase